MKGKNCFFVIITIFKLINVETFTIIVKFINFPTLLHVQQRQKIVTILKKLFTKYQNGAFVQSSISTLPPLFCTRNSKTSPSTFSCIFCLTKLIISSIVSFGSKIFLIVSFRLRLPRAPCRRLRLRFFFFFQRVNRVQIENILKRGKRNRVLSALNIIFCRKLTVQENKLKKFS